VKELLDVLEIRRRRILQAQRRPIAQQHIPDQPLRLPSRKKRTSHPSTASDRPQPTGDQQQAATHTTDTIAGRLAEPLQPTLQLLDESTTS
jgi:hypothetical protein